jgi:hypothetical protein
MLLCLNVLNLAGVASQKSMLTPPWHLICPLVTPGVCVNLILTADCSFYLILSCWYRLRIVSFTLCIHTDVPLLLLAHRFWNRAHSVVTGQQRMFISPWHFILPSILCGSVLFYIWLCIFHFRIFRFVFHIIFFTIWYFDLFCQSHQLEFLRNSVFKTREVWA